MTAIRIESFRHEDPEGVAGFRTLEPPAPFDLARPPAADSHLLLALRDDAPAARVSYRIVSGMHGAPELTGVVGHYEARDDEAGVAVLREAVSLLADAGAELVVGPMEFTTWGRYGLALDRTEAGDPPPFLTEPVNPAAYPAQFEAAGLTPIAHYESEIVEDLCALTDRSRQVEKQLSLAGHRIEPMNPDRFGGTLDGLYDLSMRALAETPFFSPITRAEFQAMYEPVRSFLDPDLVLLARDAEDAVIGFIFGLPDVLEAAGAQPTRVVVRSLAVQAAEPGVNSLLVHALHRRAAGRGYQSAIHALMQVKTPNARTPALGGAIYRRYALFGREP